MSDEFFWPSIAQDDGAYRHVTLPIALYLSASTSSQEIIEDGATGCQMGKIWEKYGKITGHLDHLATVWINTYTYLFSGMNIHLPAILMFTRGTRF